MKKIVILLLIIFMWGCSNDNKQAQSVNNIVKNSTYYEIGLRLNKLIEEVSFYPTEKSEEEVIYYVKSIITNEKRFKKEELDYLYNILNVFEYKFGFNKLKYTEEDYKYDLEKIEELVKGK